MDLQTQSALLAAVIHLSLGLMILYRGASLRLHRAFAQLTLAVFLWNLCYFLYKATGDPIWNRLLFVGVFLIPASALKFVLAQDTNPAPWKQGLLKGAYVGATLFLISVATRWFDHDLWNVAALLFIFPILLIALGILYGIGRRTKSIVERRRVHFLLAGGLLATLLGPTDFLPSLGIPVPQLGTVAILAYTYAVAMGILHYHLFDLPEILGKGISFLLQIFLLGGILALSLSTPLETGRTPSCLRRLSSPFSSFSPNRCASAPREGPSDGFPAGRHRLKISSLREPIGS